MIIEAKRASAKLVLPQATLADASDATDPWERVADAIQLLEEIASGERYGYLGPAFTDLRAAVKAARDH